MQDDAHQNVSLLAKLNIQDLDSCEDLFADEFAWHYFNSELPDLAGDYYGIRGLMDFFASLSNESNGSFQVNPVAAYPVGNELVVTQVCNSMALEDREIEFDAVVVWRIVGGKVSEAWDIPAVNTVRTME